MEGSVHGFFALLPPTEHFRLRWIRPTCDFSCYSIKFHLLMPYVICVLTNVPFLARKVLNEFIWNNFHPNVAKHLANKVPRWAFGSCIWWQCVGIEIIRRAGWGKEDRRLQSRDTTHSLGSPWKEVTPVPQFPCLLFLPPSSPSFPPR